MTSSFRCQRAYEKELIKHVLAACLILAIGYKTVEAQAPVPSPPSNQDSAKGMVFLQHHDPRFREGLRRHGLLGNAGVRLHNTGLEKYRFGRKWAGSEVLAEARASGLPYYFDRITGGMPFQSLDGIEAIANQLRDDPRFLGFQAHEWGNSPIHDYERVHRLLLDKGLPFDQEHFAQYAGRVTSPYFSGGDYSVYREVIEPLNSLEDVERYLERYLQQLIAQTSGQIMSVVGYCQIHHTALRLGAKNIMAEIGNQVPLTALQIAFARGAARQFGKPFGAYYESWGGSPFGCSCALDFSPWFPTSKESKKEMDGYNIGPKFGSSRSLQRRLLFYAWLSGTSYWSEEWGAENYFSNWEDYPLTEYGRIVQDFLAVSTEYPKPQPVVPAALIMPPDTFGVDIRYVSAKMNKVYHSFEANTFHEQLRAFAAGVFATQPQRAGGDAHNLTPSPWIGCFDVLSDEAPADLLHKYGLLIYFDPKQAEQSPALTERVQVFQGQKGDVESCLQSLERLLPYRVEGRVGCAHAHASGRYLLGVFNNLGVTKTATGETTDPNARQTTTIRGRCEGVRFVVGGEYVVHIQRREIELSIPSGKLAVLSFPGNPLE